MRLNLNQILFQPGQTLLLKDIDWSTLESLLEELGDKRAARISYSGELLEIMTPLAIHESDKELIGDLVKIILEEMDLEFWALGSTTFKNAHMAQAVEPDQCFYITHEATVRNKERIDLTVDPPPDLAIEIDITARSRFDNYEKLGVPEVWRYDGKKLEMNVLQDGRYGVVERSRLFPDLPLKEAIPTAIARSHEKGRNTAMRQFRAWVRTQIRQL
ncbi:MAG: Uma2 family endonuclease [Candidatus Competibacteraceae bacterium]